MTLAGEKPVNLPNPQPYFWGEIMLLWLLKKRHSLKENLGTAYSKASPERQLWRASKPRWLVRVVGAGTLLVRVQNQIALVGFHKG